MTYHGCMGCVSIIHYQNKQSLKDFITHYSPPKILIYMCTSNKDLIGAIYSVIWTPNSTILRTNVP